MLKRSFADAAVAELVTRRFVPLLVDVTNDDPPAQAQRDRYRVVALPTLVVRDGARDRLRQETFVNAAELRAALEHALEPPPHTQ
jgi:thiol:disulfide interchange protein